MIKEFGPILSEEEKNEITEKEKEIKLKQNFQLNKSRMNVLKMKEKVKTIQEARRDPIEIKLNSKMKIKRLKKRSDLMKIDIGY